MSYGVGIDTGGTFTDSVLMDIESGKIVNFAKVPTTHHDLKKGIKESLDLLFKDQAIKKEDIKLVGVSSTLATNAVVENKGGDVALFIIGLEKHLELPVAGFKFIKGGHDIHGNETQKLDIESLLDGVGFFMGRVDSYAVISSMSFSNQTHELVAKKAISLMDKKPVYVSSDVSSVPGLEERAATTVLNARLMPVMEKFIDGLKFSVEKYADLSGLKIVNGEGSYIDFETAVERSVKTFGSGPASTAFFGAGNKKDGIVIDIGGTTTDILLVEDFNPVIDENSKIGDYETHVKSVRMKTIGLGGDSRVSFDHRKNLIIGPLRVEPLCFKKNIPDPGSWLSPVDSQELYFLRSEDIEGENRFLDAFTGSDFLSMADFFKKAGHGEKTKENIKDLVKKGIIGAIGFTPTDALSVLGRIDSINPDASLNAAKIYSSFLNIDVKDFCLKVIDEFETKIVDSVIDFMVRHSSGKGLAELFSDWRNNKYLKVNFGSRFPIIGAGAAAEYFLPGVCEKLSTELVLPDYHQVGNAIGALKIVLN